MTKTLRLSDDDFLAAERELCSRSFAHFMRRAWKHVIPDKLQWNWHLDAVADHLQAVAKGEFNRLLVNVPPGTSKSTAVGIMYPAWLWGPGGQAWHRFIGASHDQGLAIRDNRVMRSLVTTDWYQRLWPLKLEGDQNEKLYFENEKRGFRQATAVASMTGRRGHTVSWDDPLSPEKAHFEASRETALRVFTETLPTRLNDPEKSAIIVVMQRLHQDDPSGYILANDLGYEHLMIPMEFEPERRYYTKLGWTDPRQKDGELLDPKRFPPEVIARDKKAMGSYAWAGQMQQRPSPRGGGLFRQEWFQILEAEPVLIRAARGWDLAATADPAAARTAGVKIGLTEDKRVIISDCVKGQLSPEGVVKLLKQTAALDGRKVKGSAPQDPGQAGKAQVLSLSKELMGYPYSFSPETGDKLTRAQPLAAQAEAGNVYLVRGSWNKDFIDELTTFPNGKFADQVDAASRAFMRLLESKSSMLDAL